MGWLLPALTVFTGFIVVNIEKKMSEYSHLVMKLVLYFPFKLCCVFWIAPWIYFWNFKLGLVEFILKNERNIDALILEKGYPINEIKFTWTDIFLTHF